MLLVRILILVLLAVVLIQDLHKRAVYWVIFPLLVIFLILLRLYHQVFTAFIQTTSINLALIIIQILLVSLYFSAKSKQWVNITDQLLGWGDILFVLTIAFYLSVFNFLLFYVLSLLCILLGWLIYRMLAKEPSDNIPLAGLQAFLFILLLVNNWWIYPINITDDRWLISLLTKWT